MINTKLSDFLLEFIRGQFNYPEDDSFIMWSSIILDPPCGVWRKNVEEEV